MCFLEDNVSNAHDHRSPAEATNEYLYTIDEDTIKSVGKFAKFVIELCGSEYLRTTNVDDIPRLMDIGTSIRVPEDA